MQWDLVSTLQVTLDTFFITEYTQRFFFCIFCVYSNQHTLIQCVESKDKIYPHPQSAPTIAYTKHHRALRPEVKRKRENRVHGWKDHQTSSLYIHMCFPSVFPCRKIAVFLNSSKEDPPGNH